MKHLNLLKKATPIVNGTLSDLIADDGKEVEGAIALCTSSDEWVTVSTEKEFIPVSDDVGCRLRIEVSALSVADNSVLAGPIVVITDPVLAAPSPPPKRRLLAIPGAVAGIAASVRFRIISYNILAELYATKQVLFCSCYIY